MSSSLSCSVSSTASASHFDAYNNFATQTKGDKIIIGVKDGKPITASNSIWGRIYQTFFGNWNKTIIEDFTVALKEKYNESIATFAFPDDEQKDIVRALGLNPNTIKQVIDKAEAEWKRRATLYVEPITEAETTQRLDIAKAATKAGKTRATARAKDAAIKTTMTAAAPISFTGRTPYNGSSNNNHLSIEDPRTGFAQDETIFVDAEPISVAARLADENAAETIAIQLEKEPVTSASPTTITILPDEAESLPTTLITADTDEVENADSTWRDVPDTPITPEAFRASLATTQLQHQKVMNELVRRIDTNPTELEQQLTDLVTEIVTTIEKHSNELKVFSNHFDDDVSACFHLDVNDSVAVTPADAEPQPTEEENQKVWQQLFSALEGCYGKPALEKIISDEEREKLFLQPLTIARAKRFFAKSQAALAQDLEFLESLKSEPLIITQQYLNALAADPELVNQALEAEQRAGQAGAGSTSQLGMARHAIDVGLLFASSHAGLGVIGATGTVLGGPFTITALAVAALAGAAAGIIVTRKHTGEIDHSVAADAATRSATYNVGSILGMVAGESFISNFHGYLGTTLLGPGGGLVANAVYYLYHLNSTGAFATNFIFSLGGSYGADGIRDAFVGGIVSGTEVATTSAATALHADHAEDLGSQVSFESRLVNNLLRQIVESINQLPGTSTPTLSRTRPRL